MIMDYLHYNQLCKCTHHCGKIIYRRTPHPFTMNHESERKFVFLSHRNAFFKRSDLQVLNKNGTSIF